MSYIYLEIDELEDAERCAELAMKPNYSDHRRLFYINALITLGDIRMKEGKYELALSKYEEAYKWYNTIFVTDTKEGALIIGSIQERIKEAKRVMEEGG
jgi:tetratricopeptide (TPR) repeat protein